jgi:4-amino-4-deoxy-L-arabinose transferase-like glycosyltransferase
MRTANDPDFEKTVPNNWLSPLAFIFYFASLKLLIHMIFSGGYGYFRDELYYLACGEHLDWGYADHAPLIAFMAKSSRAVLGDSLFSIHLLPGLAGALKVLLTGLIVRELGGKRFAVILSCLCVLFSSDLAVDGFLSMNAFEGVFWMGCVLSFLLAINRNEPRYWLVFGALAGIGLMNKHSTLFFGFAMVIGILLTKARSQFAGKWIWIGGAIAFLIFLPNLIWQWRHDWATIELLRNVQTTGKNVILSPFEFLVQQFFIMGVAGVPAWIAGLVYFFFDRKGKRFRALGIAYLVLLIQMILMNGKIYYLLPIYPMVFAAGGVYIEKLLAKMKHPGSLKFAYPVIIILVGLIGLPIALPVLPIDIFLQYQKALGFQMPKTEVSFDSPLPQHFADRLGWPEMVRNTAEAYHNLPPGDKAKAAIYASNYGQAAAVDFFGPGYGLPKAICPHQSYFLWGPRQYTGEVMIVLGSRRENLSEWFNSVEEAGTVNHPYTMSYERFTIYICREPKMPLSEAWPHLKFWN